MTSAPSFLLDQLTVTPLDDGQVSVTVNLPPELVKDYCRFLESLAGFFQVAHRKSRLALVASRVKSQADNQVVSLTLVAYRERLVKAFDLYTSSGLDRKEAIKRIAADLRAEGHPWRSVDLVRIPLVEAGRSGRPGRPRRGES